MFLIVGERIVSVRSRKVKPKRSRTPGRCRLVRLNVRSVRASARIIRPDVVLTRSKEGSVPTETSVVGEWLGNSWDARNSRNSYRSVHRSPSKLAVPADATNEKPPWRSVDDRFPRRKSKRCRWRAVGEQKKRNETFPPLRYFGILFSPDEHSRAAKFLAANRTPYRYLRAERIKIPESLNRFGPRGFFHK